MECKILDKASGKFYDADDYLNRLNSLNEEAYKKIKNSQLKILTSKGSQFKWNKEQLKAQKTGKEFIKDSKTYKQYLLIDGKAGTGKTTIAQEILREFPEKQITIATIADQAKTVLATKLKEGGIREFKDFNLAQLLPEESDSSNQGFIPDFLFENFDRVLENDGILMIDEASMINEDAFAKIYINKKKAYGKDETNLKLIFLGDIGQVSPIRNGIDSDEKSPVFGINDNHKKILKSNKTKPFLLATDTPEMEAYLLISKLKAPEQGNYRKWISYDELIKVEEELSKYGLNLADNLKSQSIDFELNLLETTKEDYVTETLKTRVRQGEGSPILEYADNFHSNTEVGVTSKSIPQLIAPEQRISKVTSGGAMLFMPSLYESNGKINARILEAYGQIYTKNANGDIESIKNQNLVKACFYKNEEVERFNKEVRDYLFSNSTTPFVKNELFMAYEKKSINDKVKINNNHIGKINKIEYYKSVALNLPSYSGKVDIWKIETNLLDKYGKVTPSVFYTYTTDKFVSNSLSRDIEHLLNPSLKDMKFPEFPVIQIKPTYASTIHKAQGSTYDISIVDENSISNSKNSNKAKSELVYTGITRARNISIISNSSVKQQIIKSSESQGLLSGDSTPEAIDLVKTTTNIDNFKKALNTSDEIINISDKEGKYKFLDIGNFAPSTSKIKETFNDLMEYFDINENSNIGYTLSSLSDKNLDLFDFNLKKSKGYTLQHYYKHLEKTLKLISTDGVNYEARQFLLTGLFVAAIENEKNGLQKIQEGINKDKDNPMSFYLSLANAASNDKKMHNLTLEAIVNAYRYIKHKASKNAGWDKMFSGSLIKFKNKNDNASSTDKVIKDILTSIYGGALKAEELENKINAIKAAIKEKENNNKPSECE